MRPPIAPPSSSARRSARWSSSVRAQRGRTLLRWSSSGRAQRGRVSRPLRPSALAALATIALTACTTPAPAPTPGPSMTTPAASASPIAAPTPAPTAQPVAVFIGDSYTVGSGTSLEGTGFPAMLGDLRGWEVVNLGISGTGYAMSRDAAWCPAGGCVAYAGVIPDAVGHDPDVVVVSGGRNDLAAGPPEELAPAVAAFFTRLRDALPTARIVVTSPLWDAPSPPQSLIDLGEVVEREALRIGAEYLDLGQPLENRPDLIAPDGLHPNEEGLRLIAERIDALLPE
jgi:lysophospholipase L1-like esterase